MRPQMNWRLVLPALPGGDEFIFHFLALAW